MKIVHPLCDRPAPICRSTHANRYWHYILLPRNWLASQIVFRLTVSDAANEWDVTFITTSSFALTVFNQFLAYFSTCCWKSVGVKSVWRLFCIISPTQHMVIHDHFVSRVKNASTRPGRVLYMLLSYGNDYTPIMAYVLVTLHGMKLISGHDLITRHAFNLYFSIHCSCLSILGGPYCTASIKNGRELKAPTESGLQREGICETNIMFAFAPRT